MSWLFGAKMMRFFLVSSQLRGQWGGVGSGTTLHLHLQAGSTLRYPNFACIFHTWRKCMDANRLQNLGVREKPETILIWMDHIPLCSFKHDFLPCILQSVAFTEISRILLHFGSIFRSDDLPKVEAGRWWLRSNEAQEAWKIPWKILLASTNPTRRSKCRCRLKIECDRNGAEFLTCISSKMETQRSKTFGTPNQIHLGWSWMATHITSGCGEV